MLEAIDEITGAKNNDNPDQRWCVLVVDDVSTATCCHCYVHTGCNSALIGCTVTCCYYHLLLLPLAATTTCCYCHLLSLPLAVTATCCHCQYLHLLSKMKNETGRQTDRGRHNFKWSVHCIWVSVVLRSHHLCNNYHSRTDQAPDLARRASPSKCDECMTNTW